MFCSIGLPLLFSRASVGLLHINLVSLCLGWKHDVQAKQLHVNGVRISIQSLTIQVFKTSMSGFDPQSGHPVLCSIIFLYTEHASRAEEAQEAFWFEGLTSSS